MAVDNLSPYTMGAPIAVGYVDEVVLLHLVLGGGHWESIGAPCAPTGDRLGGYWHILGIDWGALGVHWGSTGAPWEAIGG